jgi:hypothetical protein
MGGALHTVRAVKRNGNGGRMRSSPTQRAAAGPTMAAAHMQAAESLSIVQAYRTAVQYIERVVMNTAVQYVRARP